MKHRYKIFTIIISTLLIATISFVTPPLSSAQVCLYIPSNPDGCPENLQLAANEAECNGGNGCAGRLVCCVSPGNFCDSVNVLVYPECTLRFLGNATVIVMMALLVIGALWLVYVFFKSAFNYIIAGDSKDKTQQSRQAMIWSTIGLFGLASVYAIFQIMLDIVPGLSDFISFG